jgi:23S rRNA pseudouridine2605 synthase
VRGRVDSQAIAQLHQGVHLAEGRTAADEIRVEKRASEFTTLTITLREGKNREVRRMFAKLGFKVTQLRRIRVGNLTDRHLREGDWRPLTRAEVEDLKAIAQGRGEVDSIARARSQHRPGFSHARGPARPRRTFAKPLASSKRGAARGPRSDRNQRGSGNERGRRGRRTR